MLQWIYKKYLSVTLYLGGVPSEERNRTGKSSKYIDQGITIEALDKSATRDGNAYRGAGVLIGLLGVAIVFCAVASSAFKLEEGGLKVAFGIAKVSMMLAMVLIIWWYQRHNYLKESWIEKRREAERLRYEKLCQLKDALAESRDAQTAQALYDELDYRLFHPKEGQLAYNRIKATQYLRIESFANRLTLLGFALALIAACWILISDIIPEHVPEQSWLILFTAFVPALVGSIHGVNGFLNVSALADDHAGMADFLEDLELQLKGIASLTSQVQLEALVIIAGKAYQQLMGHDAVWAEKTDKAQLKPA